MSKRFIVSVEIEELEEGGYLAICPDIPGCHAEGDSVPEAIQNVEIVAQNMLEFLAEKGLALPEGLKDVEPGSAELRAEILVPFG